MTTNEFCYRLVAPCMFCLGVATVIMWFDHPTTAIFVSNGGTVLVLSGNLAWEILKDHVRR